MALNRKLRMGMIGGGRDAFIGNVHRMAARLDGRIELVAGCFSSDPEKSKLSGEDLLLEPARVYGTFEEMAKKEAKLPDDQRLDFVSIVTPNYMHYAPAEAFLNKGFNIVCDKPLAYDLREARKLRDIVKQSGKVFALTHNYSGYPMVKQAREMVNQGELGTILKVVSEYPQGWLNKQIESEGQKQAGWRTDPKRAGASCCIGDIGTHAEHLARYITGLEIDALCAELSTFVPGRELDDDGNILVRFKSGAKGIIYASQISGGEENGLNIRIYGTKASLQWFQEHPNQLIVKRQGEPQQIYSRGNPYLHPVAAENSRIPPGHPEAFIEAFANIYREAAAAIAEEVSNEPVQKHDFPDINDGVYGMAFIETCVASSESDQKWTPFPQL